MLTIRAKDPFKNILLGLLYTSELTSTYQHSDKFIPQRFLNNKFSIFEYLPFGGGYRGCIGASFAVYEMKLILATIIQKIELELVDKKPLLPVRRGITIVPSGGVSMIVKSRRTKHLSLKQMSS